MIKRQDSQLISSSRRQTPPPPEKQNHAKTVGCMSGIFNLFSKYQNKKKLLTFGKKGEKKSISANKNVVTRSPMLSPKVRRPNAFEKVEETTRKPPKEVDGLMAVKEEERWSSGSACNWENEEESSSSESKRQKLLEALEKCNEDLEALKMIIKAVKRPLEEAAPPPRMAESGDRAEKMCIKKCEDEKIEKVKSDYLNNEENLEQDTTSKLNTKPERHNRIGARSYSKFVKEPYYGVRRKPISDEGWASSAMVRSVEEVCNDILWGEKREVANIGVMLHNHICKDLVEEAINELGYRKMYRFPLHGCKRRLSF